MGAIRRFFNNNDENSVFRFKIDTRYVNAGATDGSQLDNQFILPTYWGVFIVKVSDGRPDIVLNDNYASNRPPRTLTFSTPGEYEITIIGRSFVRFNNMSPDQRKMIWVYEFGVGFLFETYTFQNCINMIWDAPFVRFNNLDRIFVGIKGFGSNADLGKYIVDSATIASYTFSGNINTLTSVLSGFFPSLTSAESFYRDTLISESVTEIKILAPNLTTIESCFNLTYWRGRFVVQSEALTDIRLVFRNVTNPPSLGEVDIRRVTTTTNFITRVMSTANVDATLLGWQNNFDWSVIPSVTATYDFYNSKYSNNTSVIAAKAFLESKGITFTRLTMA